MIQRCIFLFYSIILIIIAWGCFVYAEEKVPLSYEKTKALIESKVPSQRINELIKKYGVDYTITTEQKDELKNIGADDKLIQSIRTAVSLRSHTGSISISSEPIANVVINGRYVGNTSSRLILKGIDPGEIGLRVGGVIGYNDTVMNIIIKADKTEMLDITLKPTSEKNNHDNALKLFNNGSYKEAREQFLNELKDENPLHELADDSIYWIAESYFMEADYSNAINYYEKLIEKYPNSNRVEIAKSRSSEAKEKISTGNAISRKSKTKEKISTGNAISRKSKAKEKISMGTIYLESEPAGADIYIDGESYGTTDKPKNISLPSGKYRIVLIKSPYKPYDILAEIKEGVILPLYVRLIPN